MRRRDFLAVAGALPAAVRAADAAKLKVAALEIFPVKVNQRGNWILTRVQTDGGVSGIGDASHGGKDAEKAELLRRFFEPLKGRSVADIEWLRRSAEPVIAQRGSVAAVALSGIEQCLWDILGQAAGVPCYQLFGGLLHRRIRNYANINRSTETREPAGFARMAERALAAGFNAIKMASFDGMPRHDAQAREQHTKLGTDCIRAVRQAIGPGNDLLVDAHSNFTTERGLQLARELEPMNLFWLEEVTRSYEGLAAINRAAKMPTAGGEAIYGVKGFLPYIKAEAVDVAMPDVKYCGGMLELKKIAAVCEAAAMPVSPHGPASPVGNVSAAHVCATLHNFQILEFSFGEVDWRAELIEPAEQVEPGGYLTLSDRPGLGIVLNDRIVARHRAAV